jgi:hypothetical protein
MSLLLSLKPVKSFTKKKNNSNNK